MSDIDPKIVIERIYHAFNERNTAALDELLAPDFVDHTAGPSQRPGPIGIKKVWTWIWSKHSEVFIQVEDIFSDGDRVAARLTFRRHLEDSIKIIGWMIEIFQVTDGKGVALWNMIKCEDEQKPLLDENM